MELASGQLFCRDCGARATVSKSSKNKLDLKSLKDKMPALPDFKAIGEKGKTSVKAVSSRISSTVVDFYQKRKKLIFSIAAGVLALSGYAAVQVTILSQNGPESIANKMVAAVNSQDYESLKNEQLFPNPNKYPILDKSLLSIYSESPLRVGKTDSSLFSDDAYVVLENESGEVISEISLKSKNSWNFIFYQREWSVASEAPSIEFSTNTLGSKQKASFGSISFNGQSDPELKKIAGQVFLAFPGQVNVFSEVYGFEDSQDNYINVGGSSTVALSAAAGNLVFPSSLESSATTRANTAATTCANSECSLLPYFSNDDYSWDSDPAYDFYYDYRTSSTSYSAGDCTLDSAVATSATKGYAELSCEVYSARTITSVVEYYFWSDDYTYYNGTGSETMYLTVNFSFNPKTNKYAITRVSN
jgi:hypothetical protein